MKINESMMGVLSTVACDGRLARMPQLDRKVYLEVDKILQALGGKWDRGKKAHVFPGGTLDSSASEAIDAAIIAGEVTTARDIGFFPTPPKLATELVARANVKPGMRCLEPSAGTGNIVRALLAAGGKVTAVERDEKMAKELRAHVMDNCPPGEVLSLAIVGGDFMDLKREGTFDRIVMNPPFIRRVHLEHVRHAFGMLVEGGRLVSVLPAGVKFREDSHHKAFRKWLSDEGGSYEDLPEDSFKSSGTNVRTIVITVSR